jgi:low temperature requirement protein LtrA
MVEKIKRASWLELFYDLAFVALVAQLTYVASEQLDGFLALFYTVLLSYMIFIAWFGTTVSRNMQAEETHTDKLVVQLQMVIAFTLSIYLQNVFDGDFTAFFLLFATLRGIQVLSLLRMYRLHPEHEPKTKNIVHGYSAGIILWTTAAFVAESFVPVVSLAALSFDILTPLTRGKGNKRRKLDVYHLKERLGLFLLLVIGESMLVVALSSTAAVRTLDEPLIILSGFIYMTALWWIYYSRLDHYVGLRPKNMFIYLESHGVLFTSIMLLAIAYRNFMGTGSADFGDLTLLFASGILLLITQFAIDYGLRKEITRRWIVTFLLGTSGFIVAWVIGLELESLFISVTASSLWLVVMAIYNEHMLRLESKRRLFA